MSLADRLRQITDTHFLKRELFIKERYPDIIEAITNILNDVAKSKYFVKIDIEKLFYNSPLSKKFRIDDAALTFTRDELDYISEYVCHHFREEGLHVPNNGLSNLITISWKKEDSTTVDK